MLTLMKPQYFIPIHGEFRMLHQHSLLAESVGVDRNNIFIINIGDVVDIENQIATQHRKVPAGNTLVDGWGVGDVGNIVLRDRKHLSEDGILIMVVTLSKTDGKIISGPDIISRGFVYVRESEALIDEANRIVKDTINQLQAQNINQWSSLKINVKAVLGKYLYEHTGRRPVILPIIMEI
jgi:ribonuclease J